MENNNARNCAYNFWTSLHTLGSAYLKSEIDYRIMSILIASGIGLMFSPDTFIDKLNYFIGEKSKNA